MTVAKIVAKKPGSRIISCKPDENIESITKTLTKARVGVVMVVNDDGSLAGIVSERDIVRFIAREGKKALSQPASTIMTKKIVSCGLTDNVTSLMGVMTENRIRHLPIIVNDKLEGVISIGDVVKARIEAAEREAAEMMQYITSGV